MNNVSGRDLGSFVKDRKAAVAGKMPLPPGYRLKWGVQYENQHRAQQGTPHVPWCTIVRAKIWSNTETIEAEADIGGESPLMHQIPDSNAWEAELEVATLSDGVHPLRVVILDRGGKKAADEIQVLLGSERAARRRAARDQDNARSAWPEHGLLRTPLEPTRPGENGR